MMMQKPMSAVCSRAMISPRSTCAVAYNLPREPRQVALPSGHTSAEVMSKLQRAFLIACGIAAFIAAIVLLSVGDRRGAIAGAAVAAGSLVLFGRATRSSPQQWLVVGLIAGAFLILGLPLMVVVGAAVALFVLQLVANVLVARKVGRIELERLADPAVMAGADELVRQFLADGFRLIGGYRFSTAGRLVILTVMIGPERD